MKKLILLLAVLGLAACSKSGGGLPPLTADQEARTSDVSQEVQAANTATLSQGGIGFGQPMARALNQALATDDDNRPTLSEKAKQYDDSMSEAMLSGNCTISVEGFESIPNTGEGDSVQWPVETNNNWQIPEEPIEAKLEIVNEKNRRCPFYALFAFDVTATGSGNQQSGNAQINFNLENVFRLKDTEQYNFDILSYEQKAGGNVTVNFSQQSSTIALNASSSTLVEGQVGFESSVTMNHTVNGTLSLNGQSLNVNMSFVSDYIFSDFRAVGVMQINGVSQGKGGAYNETVTYTINGVVVSEAKYKRMFGHLLFEMMKDQTSRMR